MSTYWDWQLQAACRGLDVDVFFQPEFARGTVKQEHETRAKAVCAVCPVQRACLDWALTVNESDGVWGGMSPQQRTEIAARSVA